MAITAGISISGFFFVSAIRLVATVQLLQEDFPAKVAGKFLGGALGPASSLLNGERVRVRGEKGEKVRLPVRVRSSVLSAVLNLNPGSSRHHPSPSFSLPAQERLPARLIVLIRSDFFTA